MLIVGGNKTASIDKVDVLTRYQTEFESKITEQNSYLMVIGYSFSDNHINKIIESATFGGLKIFVIDICGVDVIDKRSSIAARTARPETNLTVLQNAIIGASRRGSAEILSVGTVENGKVIRFFENQTPIVRIAREGAVQAET